MAGLRSPLSWLSAALLCLGLAALAPAQTAPVSRGTAAAGAADAKSRPAHPRKKAKAAPAPPAVPPPQPPLTLANLPPGRPRVIYRDGLLTIASDNSTLADILSAVQAQTGAAIDVPSGSGGAERVVTRLGPGPADEVLNKLLAGSRFDYVILGTDGRPGAVKTVLLRPKGSEGPIGGAGGTMAGATPFQPGPLGPRGNPDITGQPMDNDELAQPEVAPDEAVNPDDSGAQPDQQPETGPPGQNPNQPVRTPEQMLQELQRMQQMRQQQMQQQAPNNAPQPEGAPQ